MEAFLLSAFFVIAISIIVLRGFKEIRRRELEAQEVSPA